MTDTLVINNKHGVYLSNIIFKLGNMLYKFPNKELIHSLSTATAYASRYAISQYLR